MADRPRLAVLASHPIPYQAPLFRELARDARIDLHVLFLSRHGVSDRLDRDFGATFKWDVDLLSGYPSSFVFNLGERVTPGKPLSYMNPGIVRALRRVEPNVVLFFGMRSPSHLAALAWARKAGIACLYRAESNALRPLSRRALRRARALIGRMDGVVPIGTANEQYYDALGIARARRHHAPYTVDNSFFRGKRISRREARSAVDVQDGEVAVLFAGKLVARKDPLTAVAACAGLDTDVRLLIAGDGPLRADLEPAAKSHGVKLTSLGFMNQHEIPLAYCAADVLVVPSVEEPWGLVVNEAMCLGVPAVVSSCVGARLDLVADDTTGGVFRAGDARDLRRVLAPFVASAERRATAGHAAEKRMDDWDLPHTRDGIVQAVLAHA